MPSQRKHFNSTRGYGFISNIDKGYDENSTDDIFVHHSRINVKGDGYRTLQQGEYIEYEDYTDDNGKSCADKVSGIKGGPLLCEVNRNRNFNRRDDDQNNQDNHDNN